MKVLSGVIEDGVELIGYTYWGPFDIVSAGTGEMKKSTALFMWVRIIKGMAPWSA
ncbi:hypothetical protein P5G51_014920 [Virgibacillus sp. 179-BFC.A HS]|uniref:6-phospho-beta-glucosidase n=1 Tax=Tigheibacillus jepli TaxID=3035914 RepID=A0ABU5CJF0_9BACI|nr:hypothetical protein [Virgibacillus sp. 179-BFC.A HS]MDY0406483.1 hypothetical protein [Virgibacillus sp. 179-BFC.A HS]